MLSDRLGLRWKAMKGECSFSSVDIWTGHVWQVAKSFHYFGLSYLRLLLGHKYKSVICDKKMRAGMALENISWFQYEDVTTFLSFRNRGEAWRRAWQKNRNPLLLEKTIMSFSRVTKLIWATYSSFILREQYCKLPVLPLYFWQNMREQQSPLDFISWLHMDGVLPTSERHVKFELKFEYSLFDERNMNYNDTAAIVHIIQKGIKPLGGHFPRQGLTYIWEAVCLSFVDLAVTTANEKTVKTHGIKWSRNVSTPSKFHHDFNHDTRSFSRNSAKMRMNARFHKPLYANISNSSSK